jgi:hypothetical protein
MKHESREHLKAITGGIIFMLLGDNWPDISFHDPPVKHLHSDAEIFHVGYSPESIAFLKLPAERY